MRRSRSTAAGIAEQAKDSEGLMARFPHVVTLTNFGTELSTPVCEFREAILAPRDLYAIRSPADTATVYLTKMPRGSERLKMSRDAATARIQAYADKRRRKVASVEKSKAGETIAQRASDKVEENLKLAKDVLVDEMLASPNMLQGLAFTPELIGGQTCTVQPLLFRQQDGYPNKMFIAGASLCGKSYFASMTARSYLVHYPGRRVVVFTVVDSDPVYMELKKWSEDSLKASIDHENLEESKAHFVTRKLRNPEDTDVEFTDEGSVLFFPIDQSMLDDPPDLSLFSNTLCIFDDIESGLEKPIKNAIMTLRDSVINTGRHLQIDVIVARQQLLDFSATRTPLNNIYQVVGFPHSAGKHHFVAFLERYMKLPKKEIAAIMGTPSRWVLINRANPQYVLSEVGIRLI